MADNLKTVSINSEYNGFHEITKQLSDIVAESGVQEGLCVLNCNHTTAGITVNSFWDPRGHEDLMNDLDRIIPSRSDFHHQFDTPTDAAGHVKTSIIGSTLTLIVHNGKLLLGSSQGVFFAEFDGPRKRKVYVKVVSD